MHVKVAQRLWKKNASMVQLLVRWVVVKPIKKLVLVLEIRRDMFGNRVTALKVGMEEIQFWNMKGKGLYKVLWKWNVCVW